MKDIDAVEEPHCSYKSGRKAQFINLGSMKKNEECHAFILPCIQ